MQRVFLITLLFSGLWAAAQFGKNCELRQFKINIVNPGVEYEIALGVNTTFDVKLGIQAGLDPSASEIYKDFGFFPAVTGQFRYYYNFEKRQRNRKQVYGNSANYVAPAVAVFGPALGTDGDEGRQGAYGYAGLVTGLQRSYNSGFNFSIDLGGAYYTGAFKNGIYPVANLGIGWIFSEKRWCVGR